MVLLTPDGRDFSNHLDRLKGLQCKQVRKTREGAPAVRTVDVEAFCSWSMCTICRKAACVSP